MQQNIDFLHLSKEIVLFDDENFDQYEEGENENNVFSTVKFEWKEKDYLLLGALKMVYIFSLETYKIHSKYSIHESDIEGLCPFEKNNKLFFLTASQTKVHFGRLFFEEKRYEHICHFPASNWTRSIWVIKSEKEEDNNPKLHITYGTSDGEFFICEYDFEKKKQAELIKYKTEKMVLGVYQFISKPNHICFVGDFPKVISFDYIEKIKNAKTLPHTIESLKKETTVFKFPTSFGTYYNRVTSFITSSSSGYRQREILIIGTRSGCLIADLETGNSLQFVECGECCHVLTFSSRYFLTSGIIKRSQEGDDYGITIFEFDESTDIHGKNNNGRIDKVFSIQNIIFTFDNKYMTNRELRTYALGEIPICWRELLKQTTNLNEGKIDFLDKSTLISSTGKRLFFHKVNGYYLSKFGDSMRDQKERIEFLFEGSDDDSDGGREGSHGCFFEVKNVKTFSSSFKLPEIFLIPF